MGGGETPSPTPIEPLTISLKIVKSDSTELDYPVTTGDDSYTIERDDVIRADFSRPLTNSEINQTSAIYLINQNYEGIIIVNNGDGTISCWFMDGINTIEETETRNSFDYPKLACLTAIVNISDSLSSIGFTAPVGKWGPRYAGPLSVTPSFVSYPSFDTVNLPNYNGSSNYPCLTTADGKLILCGLGYKDLDWDSNYPEYTVIYYDGRWDIGENMADVNVSASAVKNYISEHGYELWPDGNYINSQLFAFVDGKIVVTLVGPPDGPGYVSNSITIPAFPSI